MSSKPFTVGVLTVSDTASVDASADKSGPAIRALVVAHGFRCDRAQIVPDADAGLVRRTLEQWTSPDHDPVDWIITTGGTGFGTRDATPDIVAPLLTRHAPGLVHLILADSMRHTPLAALSRPVAGTIANTLVLTLPGSLKAVRENIAVLLAHGLIDHALDLIRGGTGRDVHSALAASSGPPDPHPSHHHHHHHHHTPTPRSILSHDPSLPATSRHRVSPYPLFSFQSAIDAVFQHCAPLDIVSRKVDPNLAGHVLAEDVYASHNIPASSTTSVDGYALRSSDPPGVYTVHTPQTHSIADTLPPATIYRINTGAPLPKGSDTVIMVEDTKIASTSLNDQQVDEEHSVETLAQVPKGENVRLPGSDVRQGDLVIKRGEVLHSIGGEIGTLAFVGRKQVQVYKKPVVALLSTGDELKDIQSPLVPDPAASEWSGIWDTNRPSLQAALEGLGYEVLDLGIVSDSRDAHKQAIKNGLDNADLLLTTGGTSMGVSDLLKPVIERDFQGTIHFGRVAVKPGKPTTFATIPYTPSRQIPVFALPGNPASAIVTFHVFVLPALRRMGGWPVERSQLPRVRVQLQDKMKLDPRTEFHRVNLRYGPDGFKASSTGGQRSSRVASLSGANGLVILPPLQKDGPETLEAGAFAEAIVIGEIQV